MSLIHLLLEEAKWEDSLAAFTIFLQLTTKYDLLPAHTFLPFFVGLILILARS